MCPSGDQEGSRASSCGRLCAAPRSPPSTTYRSEFSTCVSTSGTPRRCAEFGDPEHDPGGITRRRRCGEGQAIPPLFAVSWPLAPHHELGPQRGVLARVEVDSVVRGRGEVKPYVPFPVTNGVTSYSTQVFTGIAPLSSVPRWCAPAVVPGDGGLAPAGAGRVDGGAVRRAVVVVEAQLGALHAAGRYPVDGEAQEGLDVQLGAAVGAQVAGPVVGRGGGLRARGRRPRGRSSADAAAGVVIGDVLLGSETLPPRPRPAPRSCRCCRRFPSCRSTRSSFAEFATWVPSRNTR